MPERESKPSKNDVMVTSLVAKFQDRHLASPTSSLELIISLRGGGSSKTKATSKVSITSFGKDTRTATQKAHDVISMEDLEPLMGKPSFELMSSHVYKLMQVCVLLMHTFFLFFICHLFFTAGVRRVLVHL